MAAGCETTILNISRHLDDLIVQQMKVQNKGIESAIHCTLLTCCLLLFW